MLTTHLSLIQRLSDSNDHEAWRAFVEIYYPAIIGSLKAKGLKLPDAEDAAQKVFVSVAKSLAERPHDPDRARFRTWLSKVIRNTALNALQRVPKDIAAGGSDVLSALHGIVASEEDEQLLDQERRKQLFRIAAKEIECEFEPASWQAFWRTAIQGESIESVAKDLGKQIGSIYAARSRIIRRLRKEIDGSENATE